MENAVTYPFLSSVKVGTKLEEQFDMQTLRYRVYRWDTFPINSLQTDYFSEQINLSSYQMTIPRGFIAPKEFYYHYIPFFRIITKRYFFEVSKNQYLFVTETKDENETKNYHLTYKKSFWFRLTTACIDFNQLLEFIDQVKKYAK